MAEFINELKYGDIAKYGRRGDTMIAHINPNEAAMLKRMGGAGTINPMTGLPEFWWGGGDVSGWDDSETGYGPSGGGSGGGTGGNEGSGGVDIGDTPEQSNEPGITYDDALDAAMDIYASDEDGITFGGGISPEGLSDLDIDFARALAAQDNIPAVRDKLNKEGIPQEYYPYYNSLKARGLSNEDAIAALAAAVGAPGGAASLSSGYSDGYSYGGPMGTLEGVFSDYMDVMNKVAAREREKAAKEQSESDDLFESGGSVEEPGFFASILSSLNPLAELTPQQKGVLQSYENLGLNVRERSAMDNLLGFGLNLVTPGSIVKSIAEKATGSSIIGLATDPATGFDYLIQANGDLQLAPGELGYSSSQDGGNEPIIPKKREAVTEAPKEEEKEEEVVEVAEKEKIKPSAYQNYLADLLYPNTSDIFKKAV